MPKEPGAPPQPNPPAGGRARLISAARWLVGLALLAAVAWWLVPGPDDRQALLARARLRPGFLTLGLLATFLASVVTSARWRRISEDAMAGDRLPLLAYFHALTLTRVLGQVSSTLVMDLVGRGLVLRRAGAQHGLGHSMTQAVLERIFDLVLPALMLAWAAMVWQRAAPDLALAGFITVCLGFVALAVLLFAPLTRLALRTLAALRRLRAGAEALPLVAPPITRALALRIGLLSLARYLAVLAQFWAVAAALGVDLAALQIAAATPIGQLAGMIGVTPGALGIQEAGWLGALRWVGVDALAIGVFVLGHRLVITASFGLLAALSGALLRRRGQSPGGDAPGRC